MLRPLGLIPKREIDMDWCEYCEDILDDCFSDKVPNDIGHSINWYESSLKPEAYNKVFLLLTELYYCDCCNRHQINKPAVPQVWKDIEPSWIQDVDCPCNCRQMARMICRSYK